LILNFLDTITLGIKIWTFRNC